MPRRSNFNSGIQTVARLVALTSLATTLFIGSTSSVKAADQILDLLVTDAKASRHGAALLDVPFFMAGEQHPTIARRIGEWPTNRRTNAFGKAKTDACRRVFISAIRSLQQRAQVEGGDAIVDIRSNTKNQSFESATEFRCAAGAVVANVALTGTIVKFGKD